MTEDRIGYRYAKSLFELAKDTKELEKAKADMDTLHDMIEEQRDFKNFLNSPLIQAPKKQAVLDKIFSGSNAFASTITPQLVKITVEKGREMFLGNIASAFLALYDEEKNIFRGTLTTAGPLSDAVVKTIKKEIEAQTGGTFEFEHWINPDIIGGFILKIGDEQFDGSVVSSLRRMKQSLSN